MTLTITNQDPTPGDVNVSPFVRPRFTIATDDLNLAADLSTLDVYFDGRKIIDSGVPQEGTEIEDTGLGGFLIILQPRFRRVEEDTSTARVVVDDIQAGGPIDISWSFTIADARGPILADVFPPPGSIATSSPPEISFRVTDPGAGFTPLPQVPAITLIGVDLEHIIPPAIGPGSPANQASFVVTDLELTGDGAITSGSNAFTTAGAHVFTGGDVGKRLIVGGQSYFVTSIDSITVARVDRDFTVTTTSLDWELKDHSFEGRAGSTFLVETGPSTGEIRRITSVQGPGLLTYDGAQMTGTSSAITVFHRRGLDVYVDGVRVIDAGFPDPDAVIAGWVPNIVVLGNGDLDVTIGVPVTFTTGQTVRVLVRAPDSNPDLINVSDINYEFLVGDVGGPFVTNISPKLGSKGLGLSDSLVFDFISSSAVDTSTIDVLVDGVAAITAGSGVGDFTGSTILSVASGEQVTLIRGAPFTDGKTVFVNAECADVLGNQGERRIYNVQFGTTIDEQAVNSGLGASIVRVVSFDLSETSFANPRKMGHNGFAADGFRYVEGSRTFEIASWFTELGAFPLSGNLVISSGNGWAIVRGVDSAAWIDCTPLVGSGWSMAGNDADSLVDGDIGPDAIFTVAGADVFVIDFTEDRAARYNAAGKTLSGGDISQRDGDQTLNLPDTALALPIGPYESVSIRAWQTSQFKKSLALAVGSNAEFSVLHELSQEILNEVTTVRNSVPPASPVFTRPVTGTWERIVMRGGLDDPGFFLPLVAAYNDGGQGTVEVSDWFNILSGKEPLMVIDDLSTPSIPSSNANDVDVKLQRLYTGEDKLIIMVATDGQVDIWDVDFSSPIATVVTVHSAADLGLTGTGDISALSMEDNFLSDFGFFYVSTNNGTGRVVHFREHSPSSPNRTITVSDGTPFDTVSAIGITNAFVESYVKTSMRLVP